MGAMADARPRHHKNFVVGSGLMSTSSYMSYSPVEPRNESALSFTKLRLQSFEFGYRPGTLRFDQLNLFLQRLCFGLNTCKLMGAFLGPRKVLISLGFASKPLGVCCDQARSNIKAIQATSSQLNAHRQPIHSFEQGLRFHCELFISCWRRGTKRVLQPNQQLSMEAAAVLFSLSLYACLEFVGHPERVTRCLVSV